MLRIQHDRGGNHRSCQWPAPDLVATRDRPNATLHQLTLAPEARLRDGRRFPQIVPGSTPNHSEIVRVGKPGDNAETDLCPLS
jgi:hypothetical protein